MSSPFLVLNRWEKQGAKDWEYYTLESLLYFVNNKSEPHPGYCQKAAFQGIKAVRRPDRKALLNYFKGDEGQFIFYARSLYHRNVEVGIFTPIF